MRRDMPARPWMNIGMKIKFMQTSDPQKWILPRRVHLPPGGLGEPVVDAREDREDRARRHHVMEVADHVVGVVQVDVGGRGQRHAGQAADAEHRQEREREEHRRGEADRAAPQRHEQRGQDDAPTGSR